MMKVKMGNVNLRGLETCDLRFQSTRCYSLDVKCPPKAHVFGHLVPRRQGFLGRLRVEAHGRKWITECGPCASPARPNFLCTLSWTVLGLQSLLTYLPHQDELHPWCHKSKETLLPNLLHDSHLVRAMRKAPETLPLFLKWVDRQCLHPSHCTVISEDFQRENGKVRPRTQV